MGKNALPMHVNSLHQINDTSDFIMIMPALKTVACNDAIDLRLKVIVTLLLIRSCHFIYYRAAAINK